MDERFDHDAGSAFLGIGTAFFGLRGSSDIQMDPRRAFRDEFFQECRGQAAAAAGLGDGVDQVCHAAAVQGVMERTVDRQAPDRFSAGIRGSVQRVEEDVVVGEDAGVAFAQRRHAGARGSSPRSP